MTNRELITLLKTLQSVSVFSVRASNGAKLPYLVVVYGSSDNFEADNTTYTIEQNVRLELYTEYKNETVEAAVEGLLVQNELPYQKDEAQDDDQQFYVTYYDITRG